MSTISQYTTFRPRCGSTTETRRRDNRTSLRWRTRASHRGVHTKVSPPYASVRGLTLNPSVYCHGGTWAFRDCLAASVNLARRLHSHLYQLALDTQPMATTPLPMNQRWPRESHLHPPQMRRNGFWQAIVACGQALRRYTFRLGEDPDLTSVGH